MVASISSSNPTFSGSILTSALNLQAEINSEQSKKKKVRQIPILKLVKSRQRKVIILNCPPHRDFATSILTETDIDSEMHQKGERNLSNPHGDCENDRNLTNNSD